MAKKRVSRIKILPDKIFHKLWDDAATIESEKNYVKKYLSVLSDEYINFKKYNISDEQALELIRNIYLYSNMTFKEITNRANKNLSDIAHTFCISYRTVESWNRGVNKCPGYIRLMLLKQYKLLDLGKGIKLESEKQYDELHIPKYNKTITSTTLIDDSVDDIEEFPDIDLLLEKYDRLISKEYRADINSSLKTRELLEKTNYLDSIINRK